MEPGKRRRAWLWIGGGLLGLLLTLVLGAFGYWQYATAVPERALPPASGPPPRGYLEGMDAALAVQQSRGRIPKTWPEGTTAELETAVAPVRPSLQRLRASFQHEWRVPVSRLAHPRDEYAAFREAARCLAAEATLAERRGDPDAALGHRLDALELGVRLRRGDTTLGNLVGLAVTSIGLAGIEPLPARVSPAALETALARLRHLRADWPPLGESVQADALASRVEMVNTFRDLNRLSLWRQWDALDQLGGFLPIQKVSLLLSVRRNALAEVDGYYRALAAEVDKPTAARAAVPVPANPWAQIFCVQLPQTQLTRDRSQLALVEAALAAELWHRRHGRYPRSWEELSGKWLPEVPRDAWERPLIYRLKAERPLLYSLGPDGKDDGGRSLPPGWFQDELARGDLVYGQLSPRRGLGGR